jgi:hypothetical protein
MKRMSIALLILWIICTGLIAVACDSGPYVPYQDALATLGFDLCGGDPCYLGIVPGETSWRSAQEALPSPISEVMPGQGYHQILLRPGGQFIEVGSTDATVDRIWAGFKDVEFTLADVIHKFGYPCGVRFNRKFLSSYVELSYPSMLISVGLFRPHNTLNVGNWLAPDLWISSMVIVPPQTKIAKPCHISLGGEIVADESPWLGFAARSYYLGHSQPYVVRLP